MGFVRLPRKRLVAVNELVATDNAELGYEWQAIGDDPQFILKKKLPHRGWHMLEVAMSHNLPSVSVKLYLDMGTGFTEALSVYLPVKSGRITKRLFYVPKRLRAIRLDPMESSGLFSIIHFRIVWLVPNFAYDRLAQRLVNMHHAWRDTPKNKLLPHLKKAASNQKIHWRDLALRQYEATFERRTGGSSYTQWLNHRNKVAFDEINKKIKSFNYKPLISILLPVYNTHLDWLRECIDSLLAQHYTHWQLCVSDDASTDPGVRKLLDEYAADDDRIDVVYRNKNGHICAASNTALELAKGEFVALLDHDDCLTPDALFQVVNALQTNVDAGLLYTDEDKINEQGERFEPHFKPQWNPDLLLAQNYISHLGVYRTGLVRKVGGFRQGFEGSQDHDLVLRVTSSLTADQIVHIAHVCYHWRATKGSTAMSSSEKRYTSESGVKAVREHVAVRSPNAKVEMGALPNTYRVIWPLPKRLPLVSLMVPTRDRLEILQPCIDAILSCTNYPEFEVLILDNQSSCRETLGYMRSVAERDTRVRILRWDQPFNYSAINNFGAQHARGEILGLVNNDIEPIHETWLEEMVRQVLRPEIGCVGAKLYYPNDTIQHAGVVLGIGGVAGHAHKYFDRNSPGYFSRLHLAHNVSAVTGACLLVRKSVFEQLGGLDESNLKISFNDVDFCLKVRNAGYRNLFTPYAELYHHESASRGENNTLAKRALANAEASFMRQKWGRALDADPYYNPNLTLVHEDFSLN